MNLKSSFSRAGISGAVLLLSVLATSPASACLRTHQLRFEPSGTGVSEPTKISDFLQLASYGGRQKIIARVSGPDGELARRRVRAVADLLVSLGLAPTGIMLETDRSDQERAILIAYPAPRPAPGQIAAAGASPAAPSRCGG